VGRHAARTGLQYLLVLFAAVSLNFLLPRLAPGDAIDYLLPPDQSGAVSPEQRQELLAQFGLDGSLAEQYGRYLQGLARGDLLVSVRFGRPVGDVLGERLGWTLLLVGSTLVASSLLGSWLGFRAGWSRGSARDAGSLTGVMAVDSLPPFFVGMLLLVVFSVQLRWFPTFGALPPGSAEGVDLVVEVLRRLALPFVTLTLASVGPMYLVARSAMVTELEEDYVLMAEAKGLGPAAVRRHARRNALMPVSTVAMVGLGTLVGGATVVETVFSYPGLGRLVYDSVLARDFPLLQGAFLLLITGVIVANFLNDLLYPLLDPRTRHPLTDPA